MFSKKGQGVMENNLIMIILVVVGLILILGVLFVFFNSDESVFGNWICKASVYLGDQTMGIGGTLGFNKLLCKTYYKKISEEDSGKVMKELARDMQKCWWMFGEGELDPKGTNWLKWGETKCFKCYKLEVTKGIKDIVNNQVFVDYLENTDIEKTGNQKVKYYNYFNRNALDKTRFVIRFDDSKGDKLEMGDFVTVAFFEEVEPTKLNPLFWGYHFTEFAEEQQDYLVITKDNPGNELDCVEME